VGFTPGINGELGDWNLVWTQLDECTGTAVLDPPSSSPTRSLWNGIGCPDAFMTGVEYKEGDRVEVNNNVYKCKPFPYSGSCGQAGFEPGSPSSSWKEAWTLLGSCRGTISPTSSPNYNLVTFGGCPSEYSTSVHYKAGDLVSSNGVVFRCRPFPYSSWCSHDGYAPHTGSDATRNAGSAAWETLGVCDGTMSPTSAPNFDTLADLSGCPMEWVEGGGEDFVGGEKVTLSVGGGRGVVYQCAEQWREYDLVLLVEFVLF
jgi:hypothetical protein